jgi:DNA-binding CsgD family transcriptional regulator
MIAVGEMTMLAEIELRCCLWCAHQYVRPVRLYGYLGGCPACDSKEFKVYDLVLVPRRYGRRAPVKVIVETWDGAREEALARLAEAHEPKTRRQNAILRRVIWDMEGISIAEIAEREGITASSVRRTLAKYRDLL